MPPLPAQSVDSGALLELGISIVVLGLVVWLVPVCSKRIWDLQLESATVFTAAIRRRRRGLHRRTLVIAFVSCAILVVGMSIAVGMTVDWRAVAVPVAKACDALVIGLIGFGLVRRTGRGIVCARCDYPMVSWHAAAPRCPECGLEWRRHWKQRWGKRDPSWLLVIVGLLIAASSATLVVVFFKSLMP
jgi:hypothetical protein